jgi:hypothetical protein
MELNVERVQKSEGKSAEAAGYTGVTFPAHFKERANA